MYWAWLWGLPGLLLASPLAACLKVAGDYIPDLGFLQSCLARTVRLTTIMITFACWWNWMSQGARTLAINYCDTHGLEATFDDVLIPALTWGAGTD
jgi:hypothetical protein